MSEAIDHDNGEHEDDSFDLSDVPMDGDPEGGEEQESAEPKKDAKEGERTALPPEELEKRHASTKVALATERAKRREAERTAQDLSRRLEALERGEGPARRTRQEEPEEDIDPDVDPVGALKALNAKVRAYEAAERQESLTTEQRQAQERQFSAIETQLQEFEADFKDDQPDYDDAAKHYAVARAQELMNFGLQPAQVQPMLREEFARLAATAIRAGKNPAAVVYELAKGRGFGRAADPNPAPAPAKPGKLDAVVKGQRAASPLGGSGGRVGAGVDAVTVANINIRDSKGAEAFDKAWEKLEREARRAERG